MAFINEWDNSRTIDYERNAVLTVTGGIGSEHVDFFELLWRGQIIKFAATYNIQAPSANSSRNIGWIVSELKIPETLESERKSIKKMISEALEAHGFLYNREHIKNVSVEFSNYVL